VTWFKDQPRFFLGSGFIDFFFQIVGISAIFEHKNFSVFCLRIY